MDKPSKKGMAEVLPKMKCSRLAAHTEFVKNLKPAAASVIAAAKYKNYDDDD